MKLYSINIQIAATAYIKAESPEEATRIAVEMNGNFLELVEQDGDLPISGAAYNSDDLPDVSLSPAMTIHGVFPGDQVEEVE